MTSVMNGAVTTTSSGGLKLAAEARSTSEIDRSWGSGGQQSWAFRAPAIASALQYCGGKMSE